MHQFIPTNETRTPMYIVYARALTAVAMGCGCAAHSLHHCTLWHVVLEWVT